ncbi:hypothetical protein [uncultured Erythrobacter sp.]|uniref:hypothetical protein n=1 Tax=uncultured Erythrobacter sp. TaxID=263913 RepID=UPI002639530C|nr:hypothetical protein [uncultured Erythrobacter sp.]
MPLKPLISLFALALPLTAVAQEQAHEPSEENAEQSQFVGRYDGSSMETAMGMVVRPDGSFQWGLSVGSLDLRAKGTWYEQGGMIAFTSDPKPVAPEFVWSGIEETGDGPFLRINWAGTEDPFTYADVRGLCANGDLINTALTEGVWSPDESCDKVVTIEFYLSSYQVLSAPFELVGERKVNERQTIQIEFHRNDLGLADFDGVTGVLQEGKLRLEGSLGAMTLRKLPPPAE